MEDYREYETVMIRLSNGQEQEFAIMEEFDLEGMHYIAVSAVQGEEIQEGFYIYRAASADGELEITQIEDEEEFTRAAEYFGTL